MMSPHTLEVGIAVKTADDKELGKIKEVADGCFKVDAPMAPDYWLSNDAVTGASADGIKLKYSRDELDEAKQEGPEHSGYHRHM